MKSREAFITWCNDNLMIGREMWANKIYDWFSTPQVSDEEIKKMGREFSDACGGIAGPGYSWMEGAKWMRDTLKEKP